MKAAQRAAILSVFASTCMVWADVEMECVRVGGPANVPDTRYETPGYGAVHCDYNIGKYEVTAGQYMEFLNAVAGVDAHGLYNTNMWSDSYGCKIERYTGNGTVGEPYRYRVAGDWANRPVNYVSWGDAARFANWLHNDELRGAQDLTTTEDGAYFLNGATSDLALLHVSREPDWKWAITSEDEWYKAAYHRPGTSSYYDYPTSSSTPPGYVNNSGNLSTTGTPFVEGGTDPGNYATYDGEGGTDGIGSPYLRSQVGEWENSDSPYGTFDQGGNVWEWNEAILSGTHRGIRGGSLCYRDINLLASYRSSGSPTNEYLSVGFRVVEIPEPTMFGLLVLGGLGMVSRKRKS